MSEQEKGTILNQIHNLPPMLRERALGFMQGLTASSTSGAEKKGTTDQAGDQKKPDGEKKGG